MTATSSARADTTQPVVVGPRGATRRTLSPLQQRIWTSRRLTPSAPQANMATAHRLSGRIDPDRLAAAFDTVVRRSDVLRTVIDHRSGGLARARVLLEPPAPMTTISLDAADVDAWCADRISRPIDLSSCAYDSVLIRHHDDAWTWWLNLDHLVTDAWSSMLVFDLVADAYLRAPERNDSSSGDWPASFYDHVVSKADRAIADAPMTEASSTAALYGPRGATTTAVTHHRVELTGDIGAPPDRYRTFSADLTTMTLSGAALATALHRLSGAELITLGVPVHHRTGAAAASLVGPLMEIYPLVVHVDPTATFGELFDHVHTELLSMLRGARTRSAPDAAVDAIVNVQTATYGDFAGIASSTRWHRSTHVEAAHPIRLHAWDYGDGLRLELDLNTGLSQHGTHTAFSRHLALVFDAALERPESIVGDVDLLTDADRTILDALNPPALVERFDTPVHQVIAERLRAKPDHIVADHGNEAMTAGQLDERADALAHWLRANGLARGGRVGIRMARSLDVLVSIHGVLRAGAAFVMLDPEDPEARHAAIADDAGLALILDALPHDLDHSSATDPGIDIDTASMDDLAYVIYTSGSTGTPKGVPISHRGLADYLANAVEAYRTPSDFVMPLHSALVFDLSITSLFLPQLMNGRTVIVGGDPVSALSAIAADTRITVLKATPSQLEILTRVGDEQLSLDVVIVGGEAFRRPVAAALAARSPGVRIFNEYGPAEAVVGCMLHEWDPDTDLGVDVPIGRATPGAQVYVLDERRRPLPVGAWGELYVARSGMATGYLGLTAETAEKFGVVAGVSNEILYRTGDRVRVEHDVLVYGGRLDDQLSVSGVRLEPGEIEAALMRHPGVTNAVVRVWSPGAGGIERCERCGLGSDVPGISIDHEGICTTCRDFDRIEPQTRSWFRDGDDLDAALAQARSRASGDIDCLHLLSGGKDSTYALYQLVERGWRVHALTLDNGFISDGAKDNVRRSVADLGITHEFVTTDAMNEIFRDSLDRFANVCNGCYKTIYTLATARAHEMGIPVIVTGLSRGQFFETRLLPHQFEADRFDPDEIDRTVLQARRAYHQTRDAVTELLPEHAVFERTDIDVLDEIEYLDFFRYVDVELAEMYDFLENRAPWVRPDDTGRSTNCLVNVVGIHTHQTERGYHNYAEPYSWDVRLGHKTRDEALDELDDAIDPDDIAPMLDEIGFTPSRPEILTAWYQTDDGTPIDPRLLSTHLRDIVSSRAVPAAFVHVADLPIADSTKLDVSALPAPSNLHVGSATYVAPTTTTEATTAEIWATVLGVARVGLDDDFFDLGGASLLALEVVAATERRLDVELPDALVFEHRRLDDFARAVDAHLGTATALAPIPDTDANRPLPLSAGEEAMLFEYRADPTDVRYNVTRHYVIDDDDVDPERLERAFRSVVERHGPLHTAFDDTRTRLTTERALSFEPLPDGAVQDFVAHQRGVPFDLDNGPLVRVHAGRRDDGWNVVIGLHHITVDAGAFDVLWNDLDALYHGRELEPLATSYAAHASWQRTNVADHAFERTASDFVGVDLASTRFGEGEIADGYLHRNATVSTTELSAAASTTPFAAALAAASVALSAYSRDGVVELGITASTKDHPSAEPLVGYFLNSVPVVIDLSEVDTLADVDDLASAHISEVVSHRTEPFADVVRSARRRGERVPDISHMLAYERLAPARFGDAAAEHRIVAAPTAVNDLTFFVQERGDDLAVGLEYRGRVVSEAAANDLLRTFDDVLTSICRRPGRPIADARSSLAGSDLAGARLESPSPTVLHDIVAFADATPDAIAAADAGGAALTYGDLMRRAGSLADELRSSAAPVRRVGVALTRSTPLVEAMIGVWLAGAAYVPIDPSTATTKRNAILDVAGLDAIVVDASTNGLFDGVRTIHVDRVAPTTPSQIVLPDPDTAAYVIFTSGSTGTPAGVEVSHANLVASTAARAGVYGPDAPRRFLVTPIIGFDSSMVGLVWPLATGGTVVLPDDETVHDVDRLGDFVDRFDVSHLLMVPSLYAALLQRRPHRLTRLHTVIVAGEATHHDLVEAHAAALPEVALVNEYGPTEATIWATAHRCAAGDDPVPIGLPVPGARLRVADGAQRAMASGSAGELLISGPGVVAGYVSGRSNDAFVETRDHGGIEARDGGAVRWYRTGDLVRVDAHGRLVFLGRVDDQLNVGGLRLEPVEIEAAVRELDGVTDAVAVEADFAGRASIVVHLVGAADRVTSETVRAHVTRRLGAAAAPARIAFHERLPRTSNGKLDRAGAARLAHGAPEVDESPPATAGTILEIWRRAFGRDDIDADGDFFALGGDSLTAVAVVSALADLVGRDVEIAELLAASTPQAMATRLGITGGSVDADEPAAITVVTLRAGAPGGPTVVMTPAWDSVMGYRDLADGFPEHVRVVAASMLGAGESGDAAFLTIDELGLATIDPVVVALGSTSQPVVVVGWSIGGVAAYDLGQRLAAHDVPVASVALVDTIFPGEHRHIWSNRWWKYKSMLRPGSFGEATRELGVMGRRRVDKLSVRVGRKLLEWGGQPTSTDVVDTTASGVPFGALDDRPVDSRVPVTLYAADTTSRDRTEHPWRGVVPELRVVSIEGRHRGFQSVMAADRVGVIVDDIVANVLDADR